MRNTFSTVSTTTAAEAARKGSERNKMPAASSATPNSEPDRRIGILLGVRGLPSVEHRAVIERRDLEREIAEREAERPIAAAVAVPERLLAIRVIISEHAGEQRRAGHSRAARD